MCDERTAPAAEFAGIGTRLLVCGLTAWALVAIGFAQPGAALAGWPLAQDAKVRLAFGASYTAGDGRSATHRGVDLAAEAGDRVVAPLAGHVTFAGSVPAVGGGTQRAVTIETARGSITLMPLARIDVARGIDLSEGTGVGVLAATGDASSADAHLHVGARRGDLYVDPLGLISPPVPSPADEPATRPDGAETDAKADSATAANGGTRAGAEAGRPQVGAEADPRVGTSATSASPLGDATTKGVVSAPITAPRGASAGVVGVQTGATVARPAALDGHALGIGVEIAPGVTLPNATAAGTVASAGTTRVPAIAGQPVPQTGSVGSATSGIAALATQAQQLVARGVHVGKLVALGSLAALAMLWPLWRTSAEIGIGKVGVRAVGDDVAPVPSR